MKGWIVLSTKQNQIPIVVPVNLSVNNVFMNYNAQLLYAIS